MATVCPPTDLEPLGETRRSRTGGRRPGPVTWPNPGGADPDPGRPFLTFMFRLRLFGEVSGVIRFLGSRCQDRRHDSCGERNGGREAGEVTPVSAGDDSSPGPGSPVHRRTIEFEAYDEGDSLSVTGRLRDERPWAADTDRVEHVHDMDLVVRVRKDDLTITAATATMVRFPHAECPSITDAFQALVGLSISRGLHAGRAGTLRRCERMHASRATGPHCWSRGDPGRDVDARTRP